MRQFLRVTNRGRWYKYPDVTWLAAGELQGDALSDIRTQDGRLSVYKVANDADRQRVAVALAATRKEFANVDYAVFGDSGLDELGITVQQTEGETPDETVNGLHYELGNLTVERLALLAKIVSAGAHRRIQKRQIKKLLSDAAKYRRLDKKMVKSEKIRNNLPRGTGE